MENSKPEFLSVAISRFPFNDKKPVVAARILQIN
jgi:hypothetical protein